MWIIRAASAWAERILQGIEAGGGIMWDRSPFRPGQTPQTGGPSHPVEGRADSVIKPTIEGSTPNPQTRRKAATQSYGSTSTPGHDRRAAELRNFGSPSG